MARRGMDYQPGRFVDDQNVVVFVDHRQRDGLGLKDRRGWRRYVHVYALTAFQADAGLGGLPVQRGAAISDQPLDVAAREVGQRLAEPYVEPLASGLCR